MSPARLAFEDLPRPSFKSGGLWTSSKPLLNATTKSSLQSSPLPPPPRSQPQQQQQHTPPHNHSHPHHQHQEQQITSQDAEDDLAEDIHTLWDTRWKYACRRRQHPFQDASYLDFAPLFAAFAAQGVTSARSPAYTGALVAAARHLADPAAADSPALLRACALLRVAREGEKTQEPDERKREAHRLQEAYHRRAVDLLRSAGDSPLDEVLIPHLHHRDNDDARARGGGVREAGAGRRQQHSSSSAEPSRGRPRHLPLLVRVPLSTLCTGEPCPAAVVLARDRTGATRTCEAVVARGWAAVVVEVAREEDEQPQGETAARVCASVLDWMRAVGFYDMSRVVAIGEDGDVAVRAAAAMPTLGARLCGVVARLGDPAGEEEGVQVAAPTPGCPVLVVRGASRAVASNGLWTPEGELRREVGGVDDDGDSEDLVALAAYGAGSSVCIGALQTADGERACDWMEDVMEGREPRLPVPVAIPAPFCREGDKGRSSMCSPVRPMPEWFSREATPPDSDVEMGSVCGSSL